MRQSDRPALSNFGILCVVQLVVDLSLCIVVGSLMYEVCHFRRSG